MTADRLPKINLFYENIIILFTKVNKITYSMFPHCTTSSAHVKKKTTFINCSYFLHYIYRHEKYRVSIKHKNTLGMVIIAVQNHNGVLTN